MMKSIVAVAASVALFGVAACNDGGAEKTGENMDSAFEEATQGEENLGDGPLENAGEAMDEAADNAADAANDAGNSAEDALNDATDGNPNTNP